MDQTVENQVVDTTKPLTSPASESTFPYRPISVQDNEIRLFHLSSAPDFSSPLTGHLIHVVHGSGSAPRYSALSYVWGAVVARDQLPITIDGHEFIVTKNLDSALRHLRPINRDGEQDEGLLIWIDQISINQSDLVERSEAVAQMHMTYHGAEMVIVWLGNASEDSDQAVDMLEMAARKDEKEFQGTFLDKRALDSAYRDENLDAFKKDWEVLSNFFERPWWKRLWIRQEIVFARRAVLRCGDREVEWKTIRHAHQTVLRTSDAFLGINAHSELYNKMMIMPHVDWWVEAIKSARCSLLTTLVVLRIAHAADPRDKVFGALNLVDEETRIKVDYSKSVGEVFTETAGVLLKNMDTLDILTMCEDPLCSGEAIEETRDRENLEHYDRKGLPSWAPNWAVMRMSQALHGSPEFPNYPPYNAARDLEPYYRLESSMELRVAGLIFDRVNVSHVAGLKGRMQFGQFLMDCVNLWAGQIINTLQDPYGQRGRKDALARTFLTGRDGQGQPFSPEDLSRNILPEDSSEGVEEEIRCKGRAFFVTTKGYIGLGPRSTQEGDFVSVIAGCHVPIVLRRLSDDGQGYEKKSMEAAPQREWPRFKVQGESYVHGIMDGEAIKLNERGEAQLHEITLR